MNIIYNKTKYATKQNESTVIALNLWVGNS